MLSRFQHRAVTNTSLVIGGRRLLQSLSSSDQNVKKAWQAQDNINIQRVTQKAIIHELTQEQTQTINSVVPWFLDNMPVRLRHYFWIILILLRLYSGSECA